MTAKARNLSNRRGSIWRSGTDVTAVIFADGSVTIDPGTALATSSGQVVADTSVRIDIVYSGKDSLIAVGANTPVTSNPGTSSQASGFSRIGYVFSSVVTSRHPHVSTITPTALHASPLA